MKSGFVKIISKWKYVLVMFALAVVLLPAAVIAQSEVTRRLPVVAAGIDWYDKIGLYEVTAQMVLPEASESMPELSAVASATGGSVRVAAEAITAKMGRAADFTFCGAVFLGEGAAKHGAKETLDYFLRSASLSADALALTVPGTAKDAISLLGKTDKAVSSDIPALIKQNNRLGLSVAVMAKDFAERTADTGAAILPQMTLNEVGEGEKGGEEEASGGTSGGGSGGNGKESDGGPLKAELGESLIAIFKDGKQTRVLDADGTRAYLWTDKRASRDTILLDGITAGGLIDGSATVELRTKHVKTKACFVNGQPEFTYVLRLRCSVSELSANSAENNADDNDGNSNGAGNNTNLTIPTYFTPAQRKDLAVAIKSKLQKLISDDIDNLFSISKSETSDFLSIEVRFRRFRMRRYTKYKRDNPGDFLNYITVKAVLKDAEIVI